MFTRSVKSAERTLALFELFSQRECGLTVGDVSRDLAIPQPSASMLLRNFVRLGYVDYDRVTRHFSPTIRVMLLGSWIERRFSDAGSIAGRLEDLQVACGGETVYAAIQNGCAAQYVLTLEAAMPDRLSIASGGLRSITCSAPGRILLSLKPDSEVSGWVRRNNAEAVEDRLRVREAEFLSLIRQVRSQGFATTEGDSQPTLAAMAVAVPSPMGDMPLAIGVGGPIHRILPRRNHIIECLLKFKANFPTSKTKSKSTPISTTRDEILTANTA